jgi:hypothetical protein
MEVDAAGQLDNRSLNEEGERGVGEREVAVWDLAEGDPVGAVEDIAEVPENGDVGVLPENDGGGCGEEERGY